jgi:cytoskeletal protein CcmA (bactofilin family)
MTHFDEMTALLYLENQLRPELGESVRAHASECNECRELLEALNRESIWLRESLEMDDEMVPAHLIQVPEKGSAPWGWIAAMALGIGGAYTVWNGFIEPWRAQAAEAGFTQSNLLTMLFFSGAFWKGWEAMRSMVEFTAVASVGIMILWLVRRHLSRVAPAIVALATVILALTLGMAPAASAGEVVHGDPNYTLPAGKTVGTDLIVAADSVRIDGDVDGDLIVWSRSVTVSGDVKGDIIAFTQTLRVNGPVGGNVRAFADTVDLNSTVARNVSGWVAHFTLASNAKVGGSAILGTGEANIAGAVGGDLQGYAGEFEQDGSVGRNFYVRSRKLKFGPTASIAGTATYHGRNAAEIEAGAKFASPLATTMITDDKSDKYTSLGYYWHQTLRWGASFVFGLVLLLLAPAFFFDASSALSRYAPSMGFGLLFLFATPIVAALICFTIVGLGVGIAGFLVWLIAIYGAQVIVGRWLGEKILGAQAGMGAVLGRMALGLLILRAASMLPFVGGWVMLLVVIWGLGGVVLAINRRLHAHSPAALSAAA